MSKKEYEMVSKMIDLVRFGTDEEISHYSWEVDMQYQDDKIDYKVSELITKISNLPIYLKKEN